MKTEELEAIIEGQTETQRHEAKSPLAWDVKFFAKSILAMSNLRGGGHIIVGLSDKFDRIGMTVQDISTYNRDVMKEQMSRYADPYVELNIFNVKDKHSNSYLVIQVFEFSETPVICKINDQNEGLREATIYYRNLNKRYQSSAISNSNDLRDLIEYAAIKKMRRYSDFGLTVAESDEKIIAKKLADEREGL